MACALPWLKCLVLHHASVIMSQESSLHVLNSLYQVGAVILSLFMMYSTSFLYIICSTCAFQVIRYIIISYTYFISYLLGRNFIINLTEKKKIELVRGYAIMWQDIFLSNLIMNNFTCYNLELMRGYHILMTTSAP